MGADSSEISVIVTVLNDRQGLLGLLSALATQIEAPGEVIVVDGGSTDGTLRLLEEWADKDLPVRALVAPGSNIAEGRNAAVRSSRFDWLAVTDAGCRPAASWL